MQNLSLLNSSHDVTNNLVSDVGELMLFFSQITHQNTQQHSLNYNLVFQSKCIYIVLW